MTEIVRTRVIARPCEQVWAALAEFDAISRWAPNVDHSALLRSTGDDRVGGIGVVRRIQTGRTTLLERVVSWDEPKTLAYDLEGLPPIIRSARNEWQLEATGGQSTMATLTTRLDCGPRPPQQLIARILGRRMARESESMLAGLAHFLEDPSHG